MFASTIYQHGSAIGRYMSPSSWAFLPLSSIVCFLYVLFFLKFSLNVMERTLLHSSFILLRNKRRWFTSMTNLFGMICIMLMESCSGTSLSLFSSKPALSPLSNSEWSHSLTFVFHQETGIINTWGDWLRSQIHHSPIPDNLLTVFRPFPPLCLLKFRSIHLSSLHTFLLKNHGHEFSLACSAPPPDLLSRVGS